MLAKVLDAPIVAHRKAGVECKGLILPEGDGKLITLKCNLCGAVVGTIQSAILDALEEAIADRLFSYNFTQPDPPESLVSISEQCQRGKCKQCPGQFRRKEVGEKTIFCLHSCHSRLST